MASGRRRHSSRWMVNETLARRDTVAVWRTRRHRSRMTRSELVVHIAVQNPHLFARDAEAVVDTILERIAEALTDGDRVELRNFGSFTARNREAHTRRSPQSGERIAVSAKRVIHFKPGKTLCTRLNLRPGDQEREVERLLRAS